MTEWLGSAEIAELAGMRQQHVARQAKREGWTSRPRRGRGGGREYHVSSLPEALRLKHATAQIEAARDRKQHATAATRRKAIVDQVDDVARRLSAASGLGRLAQLSGRDRDRAEARLTILESLNDFTKHSNLSRTAAVSAFCTAYNNRELDLGDDIHQLLPTVTPPSIYRWRSAAKRGGPASLAGAYGNRKGSSKIERQPELLKFLLAMLTEHPHISSKHFMDGILARFGTRDDIELPSARSVQRWLAAFKAENAELVTAITNPDAWKNKYMTAYGSASESVVRLNQLWESDATPADVMLADGRHHIMGVIDVFSRRAMLLVTKTSTAQAVATSIRRSILAFGVPEQLKTDNGSDYKSKRVRRVVDQLDIEQIFCNPFSGWEKPHIERFFRTFAHGIAEMLPGFIGHNVSERSAIDARKSFADRIMQKNAVVELNMSAADLQAFADSWIENIYHVEPHSAIGVSPDIKAAGHGYRKIEDVRALDLLLEDGGFPTVTKKGIRIDNIFYISPDLDCVGEKVHVLFDPDDLGRIHVFRGDGSFICIAEAPEYTGISRREVAIVARQRQKKRVQTARTELRKAARKENVRDVAEEILASREQAVKASNISTFPGRTAPHETAALTAASEAIAAREQIDAEPKVEPVSQESVARVTQMLRDDQAADETAEDRFRRWIRFQEVIEAGGELCETDRYWKDSYEQTSEYTARLIIYDEFGKRAFGA